MQDPSLPVQLKFSFCSVSEQYLIILGYYMPCVVRYESLLLSAFTGDMKVSFTFVSWLKVCYCIHNSCLLWYLCALLGFCWEFSAEGLLGYEMLPKVNTNLRKYFNIGIWFIWKVPTQFTTAFLMTVEASHSL